MDELDDIEVFDAELYDTSDVKVDLKNRSRREIALVFKASTADFNLIKFYLALRDYVDKIERELNIMEAADGDH